MGRADCDCALGRYEKAIGDYSAVLKTRPKDKRAFFGRGLCRVNLSQSDDAAADFSAAIAADPRYGEAYYGRGWCFIELRRLRDAVSDFDKSVELGPSDPRGYRQRAIAHILLQDYRAGEADLRKAISLSPGDLGKDYAPLAKEPPPKDALEHGRKQVQRMLADRPKMAQHADTMQALLQWATRKFAGEGIGARIDWNPEFLDTGRGAVADHSSGDDGKNMTLSLARYSVAEDGAAPGPELSFEELWSALAFELHNIPDDAEFESLGDKAGRGVITLPEYVAKCFALSQKSAQLTQALYVSVVLPWAREHKIRTDAREWSRVTLGDLSDLEKYFPNESEYPWRPLARSYDNHRSRSLYPDHQGLIDYFAEVIESTGDPQRKGHAYYMIGTAKRQQRKYAEAIEALRKALTYDLHELTRKVASATLTTVEREASKKK